MTISVHARKEISRQAMLLREMGRTELEEVEQSRRQFVQDFSNKSIPVLELDQYVIGHGAQNRSFCYRLEQELYPLGSILGSTAFKFGVYFGSEESDPEPKYRFNDVFGATVEHAFNGVKKAICDLLLNAKRADYGAIDSNPLASIVKAKLLHIYFPDEYAPIYAEGHLRHFVSSLNLQGKYPTAATMQRRLMSFRTNIDELKTESPILFMRVLYQVFGAPSEVRSQGDSSSETPILESALAGCEFISELPPSETLLREAGASARTPVDYLELQRSRSRIGARGEALVLAMEKERLIQAGRQDLAERIFHTSQVNEAAGYDILSFDEDGSTRPIEVKATTAADLAGGFFITANELAAANDEPNFHLYIVLSAMTKTPKIFPQRAPFQEPSSFQLDPVQFQAFVRSQQGRRIY